MYHTYTGGNSRSTRPVCSRQFSLSRKVQGTEFSVSSFICRTMSMLLASPKDVWRDIASYLDAPDLFNFLSSHGRVHAGLGHSRSFWYSMLLVAGGGEDGGSGAATVGGDDDDGAYDDARVEYVVRAHERRLPAVRWHKLLDSPPQQRSTGSISPREGHLACTFPRRRGEGGEEMEEMAIITGGFSDDPCLYALFRPPSRGGALGGRWMRLHPSGPRDFVYGASLTVLNSTRAVRFGGFRSGGYSDECNDLMLLTVEEDDEFRCPVCRWESVVGTNSHLATPRAYHTATLIDGRYLVVLGGMTERSGSILDFSVLDTRDWIWLDKSHHRGFVASSISPSATSLPFGRHGHSVVLDERRDRLVLFGGGSGTDLLRSGEDNSEVWECKMGRGWKANLVGSFPWTWRMVHRDIDDEVDGSAEVAASSSNLTPSEALCLGRCHCGLKISPDTALLLLGSGSPSTNGVVAFDLSRDVFVRPRALGALPRPRFTFACTALRGGYVLVHGGFSSQDGRTLGDSYVLDLAPFVKDREFAILPIDAMAVPHRAITDEDTRNGRVSAAGRRRSAREMLGRMANNEIGELANEMGVQALLMRLLANGNVAAAAELLEDSDSMMSGDGSDDEDDDSEEGIDEAIE